jgi:hypothetical protein
MLQQPIGELLAAAVDADPPGVALVLRADGHLDYYPFPEYSLDRREVAAPKERYRLEQPGYRAVFDRRRGLLYVAATHPAALTLNRYGDRPVGRGDLHVYDIGPLRGKVAGGPLHPAAVIPLGGDVSHLLLGPGGEAVYFLLHRPDGDHVGRLAAGTQKAVLFHGPEGLSALALSPEDGGTLYAAGPGAILVLDAATLGRRETFATDVQVADLSADRTGRLFLAEQGGHPLVTVLETRHGAAIAEWLSPLAGHNYLSVTPDGARLYLSTSALVGSSLRSLKVAGDLVRQPERAAEASSDLTTPVRGEFFYFPHPKRPCIITRWGRVYRLTPTEPQGEDPAKAQAANRFQP